MDEKKRKTMEDIYYLRQECPSCSEDAFRELKRFPGYGYCSECSFDNEFEKVEEY